MMSWSCTTITAMMLCLADGTWGLRKGTRDIAEYNHSMGGGLIVNDAIWKDVQGDTIKAGYGGHITEIDGVYYWVGNDPNPEKNGDDIHIYSSTTLGSNDWKHVTKAVDAPNGAKSAGMNCKLLRSPATGKYVIVAKNGLKFYQSSKVHGPYSLVRSLRTGQVGSQGRQWKIGGMSAFQDGNNAYVIISRRDLRSSASPAPRHIGIYKLTPDFLNVERELLWLPTVQREAMWVFKKGSTYYMTMSHTAGWNPSKCFYRTARSLSGPWSEENEIGMDPKPTTRMTRSHGSQCRWIMSVGENQWMFAGDRYPYQPSVQKSSYDMSKGNYVFLPVRFDGSRPIVTWQLKWQVARSSSPPKGVMCTCTPGKSHHYRCTDGSDGWCGRQNECFARSAWPKDEKTLGCRA